VKFLTLKLLRFSQLFFGTGPRFTAAINKFIIASPKGEANNRISDQKFAFQKFSYPFIIVIAEKNGREERARKE
jgi:hypothetical protein